MNIKAAAVAAANHGLITRAQALDAGMSPLSIKHALSSGELVSVRHGVYALGDVWAGLDEFGGRQRLRTRAAICTMRRDWVASHDSSAYEHGLAILEPPDPHVHVTRPGFTGAWTKNGVKHHLARFSPEQVVDTGDLRVLDLARTAVDIAREHGSPYGEIACDAVMRRGVERAQLEGAVAPMDQDTCAARVQLARDGAPEPIGRARHEHDGLLDRSHIERSTTPRRVREVRCRA